MEFYGSEEALHRGFEVFVENIPFYGFAVLCIDHPAVQNLIGRVEDRRIVTYGVSPQADYRAENIRVENGGLAFEVEVTDRSGVLAARLENLHLPMLGRHNALNRSEEHTSELQSLMRISYAVFCLKKKKYTQ